MNILERIAEYKREEIITAKAERSISALEIGAKAQDRPRGFMRTLQEKAKTGQYGLIAEIKKASPSKGLIREDFDPSALALAYQTGGALCLSVLTDGPSFQGAPEFLRAARMASSLPCLRKDFMIDPYQIIQSRALGADCVLIIMALVSDSQAQELEAEAKAQEMDVLLEVHNEEELERALKLNSKMIGINNRDLKTFEIKIATTETLLPKIPLDYLVVSESGLNTPADLARLSQIGVSTFLIGESLMRQSDVEAATRALLGNEPASHRQEA